MTDRSEDQLDALFHAARAEVVDTSRQEFAFETRVMARIHEERGESIFSWAWRLAPFFAALAIAAGVWCRTPATRTATEADVLAEAARGREERLLVTYMTGGTE